MSWYLFIQDSNGDLVSEGSTVPEHLQVCMEGAVDPGCVYVVREIPERVDWAAFVWDRLSRALVARPAPIVVDRIEDLMARLATDGDFTGFNTTQRNRIRTLLTRHVGFLLGARRFRDESEPVEWD